MNHYRKDTIRLQHNKKTGEAGTIDIYRGCPGCELRKAPCYASKGAQRRNIDFFIPVKRKFNPRVLIQSINNYNLDWVRVGCISDPSLDWEVATEVCEILSEKNITPVVITKLYKRPSSLVLERLAEMNTIFQVSMCGLTPRKKFQQRKAVLLQAKDKGMLASARINSLFFLYTEKGYKTQQKQIQMALKEDLPIVETPVRMYKTSSLWKVVDHLKYQRHLSPISGKLDNQMTAGLIIDKAYPCFSTCSETPTETDPMGCSHQCLVRVKP